MRRMIGWKTKFWEVQRLSNEDPPGERFVTVDETLPVWSSVSALSPRYGSDNR